MKTKKIDHRKPPKKHASKIHAHVYWPYLPLMLLLIGSMFLNVYQPLARHSTATLAYATEIGRSALLASTNAQRASNGQGALAINSQLNAAAQAKANDMVAKDYWSHNTPSGQEPWVFIDAQGYAYLKAGENLAYGFATSDATIIGWMNSPSHRANLLDSEFTEVGFGFSDSANFVSTGEETIVVAMYAKPYIAPTPQPAAPPPAPKVSPAVTTQNTQSPTPSSTPETPPTSAEPVAESTPTPESPELVVETNEAEKEEIVIANSDTDNLGEIQSTRLTLIQQLTRGDAAWTAFAVSFIGLSLAGIWFAKHAIQIRRYVIDGEHFVAHHPILDLIVVSIIALAVYLSQSTGVIL